MGELKVLNEGRVPQAPDEPGGATSVRNGFQRLQAEVIPRSGRVDYPALEQSEVFGRYRESVPQLQAFSLGGLTAPEEKLSFWINLYNLLVIHGVIALGIRESVREVPDFFSRVAYRVDDLLFTPNEIEHGILRGNRHPPQAVFPPFTAADPRYAHILENSDPRIHFALVRASASSPPLHFYTPERIGEQLDLAAAGFINGPEVEILPRENLLRLSPLFKWYRPDFGGHEGIIGTLVLHLDPGEARDFLIERGMAADVEWKEYDWSLNI